LTQKQEAYAASDVAHLIALEELLRSRLEALGRGSWFREECDAVAELPAARRGRDPEAFLKIKGAARLTPESLRTLASLYAWRETLAAEADVPTFKVLGNEALLSIASARPQRAEDLAKIRGISPRLRERGLLEAAVRSLGEPPIHLPKKPREVPSDAERVRVEALRTWRAEEARGRGLDVSVILPQRLIDRLARENPSSPAELEAVEGLRIWRLKEFGAPILERLRAARLS
jgi:ribonuclease D